MNQHYKTELIHAKTIGTDTIKEKLDREFNIVHQITNIDYLQEWGAKRSNFDVENSFSILDWIISEKVVADKTYYLDEVEAEQRAELVFNIFPQGNGLIHLFSMQESMNDDRESAVSDFFQTLQNT